MLEKRNEHLATHIVHSRTEVPATITLVSTRRVTGTVPIDLPWKSFIENIIHRFLIYKKMNGWLWVCTSTRFSPFLIVKSSPSEGEKEINEWLTAKQFLIIKVSSVPNFHPNGNFRARVNDYRTFRLLRLIPQLHDVSFCVRRNAGVILFPGAVSHFLFFSILFKNFPIPSSSKRKFQTRLTRSLHTHTHIHW